MGLWPTTDGGGQIAEGLRSEDRPSEAADALHGPRR